MIGIYRIRNLINNKCYYGSSKEIEKRWKRHIRELNNNKHINIILQRAWNKYGKENFVFEIVEELLYYNRKELLKLEQEYLDKNPKYNIGKTSSGGDNLTNNPKRKKIIENIKRSGIKKIQSLTPEEKKKRFSKPLDKNPNWQGGKSYTKHYCRCGNEKSKTAKTCIKCRNKNGDNNPFFGNKHSKKTIEKISHKLKNKYSGNQNIPIIIDGIEYFSLGQASKSLSIPIVTIRWRVLSKNPKYSNYSYKGKEKISYSIEEQKRRISNPQKNKKRNFNKPFLINNVEYRTLKDASDELKIHIQTIKRRLLSNNQKFKEYKYQ